MTTIPSPCRALALVASVCLATVLLAPAVFGEDASFGEDARPPAAVDAALAQAKSLRAGGRAEEALARSLDVPQHVDRRGRLVGADRDRGQIVGMRQAVVHQRAGQELAAVRM